MLMLSAGKFRPTRRHIGIQMERKQTTEDEDVTGLLVYLCKTNEPLTPLFPSFSLLSDPTRIVISAAPIFSFDSSPKGKTISPLDVNRFLQRFPRQDNKSFGYQTRPGRDKQLKEAIRTGSGKPNDDVTYPLSKQV